MNLFDYNHESPADEKDKTQPPLADPETLTPFELYMLWREICPIQLYEHWVKRQYFDLTQLMKVAIRQATITEDDRDDKRQIALSFQGHGDRTIASWSSLCVIKGASKVGKTTVASLLVAALLGNKSNPYKGHLPDGSEILWFDTEQSRTHCYKTGARIGKLVLGKENLHPKVTMLLIREYSSLVKWQFIQNVVNLDRNVKVIVIDNLADLVSSILDEQEASRLLTGLLRLAENELASGNRHTPYEQSE